MPKELAPFWEAVKVHFEQTAPQLPPWPVLTALFLIALATGLVPQFWRWSSYLVTVVHEGGHAIAGLLVGRRLSGIRIHGDRSGSTVSVGSGFIPFRIWTTWWGYPAPAVLGSFYLWAATTGWHNAAMTFTFVVSVIMFLQIRSMVAFITLTATAFASWWLWWYAPDSVLSMVLYSLGWFLIVGGVKVLRELTIKHLKGDTSDSDARALREITWVIPGFFWLITFWLATLVALAFPIRSIFLELS